MKPLPITYLLVSFLLSPFSFLPISAQQAQLKGIVTVQNSKTYTGKIQYVKNAEVEHINSNNAITKDVTGDDGKFVLNIKGVAPNTQTQINVIPYGEFANYVVVNEKELKDITLGRLTPVSVFICKKGELEQRQAEMVGINMRKLEERMDVDKKRLQKELEVIRLNNDYLNIRYSEIKDSLDIINKNMDNAFERIKEYAKKMTLENLDNRDENYVNAYKCFSRGALDSVSYYLPGHELDLKYQKIMQLQQEAKKERELAAVLTESAKVKEEFTENSLNELLMQWLLLARTTDMQNDYKKATTYYEKVLCVDSLNLEYLFEFADYLHKINEYEKSEKYYLLCLKICRERGNDHLPSLAKSFSRLAILHKDLNQLADALREAEEALIIHRILVEENSETYLFNVAADLNNLALLHKNKYEYSTALKEYEEALNIFRKFAVENPREFLPQVSYSLHNLANLHKELKDFSVALQEYEETLQILRGLVAENPKKYLKDVASTLNDLANFHNNNNEYVEALQKYKEALQIRRKLAVENPKVYLPFLSATLNNLAVLHANHKEYLEALPLYEEALSIRKEFALEIPKVFLPAVAQTLNNLAILYKNIDKNSNALEKYEEALEINRKLATENPKIYLSQVALNLHNIGYLHLINKDFSNALLKFEESLEIRKKLAVESPKKFLPEVANSLSHLMFLNHCKNKFQEALELSKEVLGIYIELSADNSKSFSNNIVEANGDVSLYSIFTKDYIQAEKYARLALEIDNECFQAKRNLAIALLFQNRFSEAELIFEFIWFNGSDEIKKSILDDFKLFDEVGVVPEECKNNVGKIKKMFQE